MLEYLHLAIPIAVPHNQYTGKLAVNNITTALYLNKIRSQCSLVKMFAFQQEKVFKRQIL